jgi:pimeloyl-ACP methyl ester carboxylesterase
MERSRRVVGPYPEVTPNSGRRRFVAQCLSAAAASALPVVQAQEAPAFPSGAWTSKTADVRGLRMHYVEQGTGPLVMLCHGFPDSWYSWRRQIPALAAAGYRVVAPDLRGYGATGGSKDVADYAITTLVADLTGLMDALGEKTCVLVGHDFGAALAWNAALLAPERFKAIAALSVPYTPRSAVPLTVALKRAVGDRFFYMLYFQEVGPAERELEADVARSLKAMYYSGSAEAVTNPQPLATLPRTVPSPYLDTLSEPKGLPALLSEADLKYYTAQFTRTGFTGPLNWYRSFDNNWHLMKAFEGAKIKHPSLFIASEHDSVVRNFKASIDQLPTNVPGLQRTVMLPNCGHWVQQECAGEVNRELIAFLQKVAR